MRKKQKSVLGMVMVFIAAGLFLPGLISGGDLEPSDPPGPTMHSLDDIYDLILEGCPDPGCPNCDSAPVAKTGQTTTYSTGDDGNLQRGVSWPNPRFTDNNDGTVTDNLTGLIWLKNADCVGGKDWSQALDFCNSLKAGDCGLTDGSNSGDWRLPNLRELQSLLHYGFYDPAVPNTAGDGKWTTNGEPFIDVRSLYY